METLDTRQKFLSFNLGSKDIAVISLQYITEILHIPLTEICAVPEMPNCVLGIYNWRGEMLWFADLEALLGYPPMLQATDSLAKMMGIILESNGKYLGLLVQQIRDIEWLDIKEIKAASTDLFAPAMSSFVQGYFINDAEEIMFNLDSLAIMQAPLWGIHN